MSLAAQNLKTIRAGLKCTQSAMAEILKVGFRTFVRYEAGERDVPVAILIKIARLGNISLEELLTARISALDVNPAKNSVGTQSETAVRRCNFKKGQIVFSKPSVSALISMDDSEKKLLRLFRQMSADVQEDCLDNLESMMKLSRINPKAARERIRKEVESYDSEDRILVESAELTPFKLKPRAKPGRKKTKSAS